MESVILPYLGDFHILDFWCSPSFDYQKRATAVLQTAGWGFITLSAELVFQTWLNTYKELISCMEALWYTILPRQKEFNICTRFKDSWVYKRHKIRKFLCLGSIWLFWGTKCKSLSKDTALVQDGEEKKQTTTFFCSKFLGVFLPE